jgi:hypothetical protein
MIISGLKSITSGICPKFKYRLPLSVQILSIFFKKKKRKIHVNMLKNVTPILNEFLIFFKKKIKKNKNFKK